MISALTDSIGNFSTTWTPLAGEAGFYEIGAAHPGDAAAPVQDSFRLLGLRLDPATAVFTVTEGLSHQDTATVENLSDLALTGLDVEVISKPANLNVSATLAGSTLSGSGTATLNYTVTPAAEDASGSVKLRVHSVEGVSADLDLAVSIEPLRPRLVAVPANLVAGMTRGWQTLVEFDVANLGGLPTGPLIVAIPDLPWMSVATINPLPALDPGQTNRITLLLSPAPGLALGPYTGSVVLNASNATLSVPFTFRALSEAKGDLRITAVDELTYYAEGAPNLAGANVVIRDAITRSNLANGVTDANGQFFVGQLPEAYYEVELTADRHTSYRQTHLVRAGQTNEISAFLSRQVVTYNWTVEKIEIEDRYKITVETTFETVVPLPVVTVEPSVIDLAEISAEVTQINLKITNHGLIAANNTHLNFPTHPAWSFEPLLTQIGVLPAKSSLTIPLIIRRLQPQGFAKLSGGYAKLSGGGGPCAVSATVCWELVCGAAVNSFCASIYFANAESGCGGTAPSPPSPIGGPGGSGGYFQPVASSTPGSCDLCALKRLLAVLKCAIDWLPVPSPLEGEEDDDAQLQECFDAIFDCIKSFGDGVSRPDIYGCVKGAIKCSGKGKKLLKWLQAIECACDILAACRDVPGHQPSPEEAAAIAVCDFFGITEPEKTATKLREMTKTLSKMSIQDGELGPLLAQARRVRDFGDFEAYLLGSYHWMLIDDPELDRGTNFIGSFVAAIEETSDQGELVSTAEQTALMALPLPAIVSTNDALNLIERWNRSFLYWGQGIFRGEDVPPGQSTNFIAVDTLQALALIATNALSASKAAGYNFPDNGLAIEFQNLKQFYLNTPQTGGICARVRLRTEQQAVISRDAFRALLEIENADPARLEDVSVTLDIRDELGRDASGLFGIPAPTLAGLSAADGSGILAGQSSGSASWTIIPASDAAPADTTRYYVGGRFTYTQAGLNVSVPLVPVAIDVLPNYFHDRDVFSDDPFTEPVEPSIPFNLAVMVENKGFGVAKHFRITSAQPQIVDNEKGLLIDFQIIASEVAGKNLAPSLTVDFGDIAAGTSAIGRWLMTSTLQGLFIDYSATFEHIDSLGNLRTH